MSAPLESLSATGWYEAIRDAARVLADHAGALDDIDGHGVGSDLSATLGAAVGAVERTTDLSTVSESLSSGAKQGAVGSAGRRLALVLQGVGDSLANADRVDAERFAIALEAAAELLAQSHDGRRPGRFAAVMSEAADAALSTCDRGAPLPDTVIAAASAGIEELERGPESDPVLAERGTVDPAGAGLLLVLDSIASVVAGEPLPERPPARAEPRTGAGSPTHLYDVGCRVIPDDGGVELSDSLENVLRELGDITVWDVTGDSWSVGVVTALPGAAVEALVEVGRPKDLRISVLDDDASAARRAGGGQPGAQAGSASLAGSVG